MSNATKEYVMKDYGKKSCFASFLPGIAGIKGIPIWCYYVNRGQGVTCFGVENKDHSIMEFYPAHMAYQNVKRTGFRTFLRIDGECVEAFHDECNPHAMTVGMNTLTISETLTKYNLDIEVTYYVLPEENVGALVRMVSIKNNGSSKRDVEIIDGMPQVIPYGVTLDFLKSITQTAKAWMQAEDCETCVPYYRVRASIEDSADVSMVEGGNYAVALDSTGHKFKAIVDPDAVFGYDNSLENPVVFREGGIKAVEEVTQITSNLIPCAFFLNHCEMMPGQTVIMNELYGQTANKEELEGFIKKNLNESYFTEKKKRAVELVNDLTEGIATKTGDATFDAYCRYTYMDNVLRGGYPITLGHNKIFYVYSRKHGDLERDYNYFSMAPEFFSQGNGNFRDINQNRRLDTFFAPFVGRENIKMFYNLIQLDGYNPLCIEKISYTVDEEKAKVILDDEDMIKFLAKPFTPGMLYKKLTEYCDGQDSEVMKLFNSIIDFAQAKANGEFGEGYWSDHWDYNLDLVDEYLSVYPEKEKDMLFEKEYTFFLSQININPRSKRYVVTPNGVRQYNALDKDSARKTEETVLRDEAGNVVYTTLLEKLVLLSAVKFAALDPEGMGIEMEGGKPGWYDALNGLPGMLGSSMAEACELERNLEYVIGALGRYPGKVELLSEVARLIYELDGINDRTASGSIEFWNSINDAKEQYRKSTFLGVSGKRSVLTSNELVTILEGFLTTVRAGIAKACELETCPTYFAYNVTEYFEDEEGIHPTAFERQSIPLFLEGPVRYLKIDNAAIDKKKLYDFVKTSDLYDKKLSMYKVNASLQEASYEIGRCRSFTPGWLENESIWLHMEYKYLLELLKSKMYEEFACDFHNAIIPFLDEETYGRSVLENSSFIASSSNPNGKIHGKGFVARLSGSTIEFLNMWKLMMFGVEPFEMKDELVCTFAPLIPDYLIGKDKTVSARFMSGAMVTYHLADEASYIPGNYRCESILLTYKNKTSVRVNGGELRGHLAEEVRSGMIDKIDMNLVR